MNQQQERIDFNTPHNGTIKVQLCNVLMLNINRDIDKVKESITVPGDVEKLVELQKEIDQIRLRNIK